MTTILTEIESRANFSPGQKWKDIDDLLRRWVKRFPKAYQENMKWVAEARQEYNSDKTDRPLRKGLLIHPHLMVYIQHFYPDFMGKNEDVREFSKRFPNFVIDEGIKPV